MRKIKIPLLSRFNRLFKHRLKAYLVDNKFKVIPAFAIGGTDYWTWADTKECPTGRFFAAMGIYREMEMNCDKEYLLTQVKAMEKILSNPKSIRLDYIMQININLKERVELMPFEDYIYKLASVIFFDKSESVYSYDWEYNKLKIERWKVAGGTLDFFSKTPLADVVPSLSMPEKDTQTYLTVTKMIAETHQALLTGILSENQ